MRYLIFLVALFAAVTNAADTVDFTLPDLDGKQVSLSDFRGKWVIVNYWATWCPPCLEEIPGLVDLYDNNRDKLVVLGIDHEEGVLSDDAVSAPEEGALRKAVASFRSGDAAEPAGPEEAGDRELLLRAFAAQSSVEWPVLDALLDTAS